MMAQATTHDSRRSRIDFDVPKNIEKRVDWSFKSATILTD